MNRVVAFAVVVALGAVGWAGGASAQQIETAQIRADGVDLTVTGACLNGDAVFRIVNNGGAWSASREFVIFRTDGHILVNKRKMRMAEGQSASFKVRGAARSGAEIGLTLEGTRNAATGDDYHARLTCTE